MNAHCFYFFILVLLSMQQKQQASSCLSQNVSHSVLFLLLQRHWMQMVLRKKFLRNPIHPPGVHVYQSLFWFIIQLFLLTHVLLMLRPFFSPFSFVSLEIIYLLKDIESKLTIICLSFFIICIRPIANILASFLLFFLIGFITVEISCTVLFQGL